MPRRTLQNELNHLAIASPQVVARRSARLWQNALTGQASVEDRAEFERMHREKWEAAQDGWLAMWQEGMRLQQQWCMDWLQACWQPWALGTSALPGRREYERAAERMLAAGLAPARRTAVANARRLSRR